jgi:hypothetical protein
VDALTLFGALAVTAMLIFYALEARSAAFVLAFAGACAASSVYGFLQGAWPFGIVEAIWCCVALRRWWLRRNRCPQCDASRSAFVRVAVGDHVYIHVTANRNSFWTMDPCRNSCKRP